MKLDKLHISGFRSHADTKIIGLKRFNIFQGPNASGKSSILDAIAYLFTGTCVGASAGRGANDLKTVGLTKASNTIAAQVGKTVLSRAIGMGPRSEIQKKIGEAIGVSTAMAQVVVMPSDFLKMESRDQKELFMSMLCKTVDENEIAKHIGDLTDVLPPADLTTIKGVEEWDKQLRDNRPLIKRQIAMQVYTPDPKVPDMDDIKDPKATLLEAERQMSDLRRERDGLVSETGRSAQARKDRGFRIERLRKEMDRLSAEMSDIGDKADYDKKIAELQNERVKAIEMRGDRDKIITDKRALAAKYQGQIEALRNTASRVSKLAEGAGCPTCTQPITEAIKKTVINSLKEEAAPLDRELKKVRKSMTELEQQEFGRSTSEIDADLGVLRRGVEEYDERLKRYSEAEANYNELVKEEREDKSAEAPAIDTAGLEARIGKGERLIKDLNLVLQEKVRKDTILNTRAHLEKELARTEKAIELLGNDGPIRKMFVAGEGIEAIEKEVRDLAADFGIPQVRIHIEPEWDISAMHRRVAMLSESEAYRLNLCFAAVMARRSGAGILCLDRADMFDAQNRGIMPQILDAAGVEQAFIACTNDDPKAFEAQEWSFYSVAVGEDGYSKVHLLEPVAA